MKRLQHYLNLHAGYKLKEDGIVGNKTKTALATFIKNEINRRGWQQPYTDLVWLRYDKTYNNKFNDFCALYYRGELEKVYFCTTTPGDYWVYNPVTVGGITGVATLCEQQVVNSHKWVENDNWNTLWLGMPYAKQVKDVDVYRDGNKDGNFDRLTKYRAIWWQSGINFHQMGAGTINWNWSAGCLGMAKKDWDFVVRYFDNDDLLTLTLIEL